MWKLWIISAGVFLILESITTGFLLFWFSIGSIFALITCFFTNNAIIQAVVFLISSTILIFTTRKFTNKFQKDDELDNTNSIIGKSGIVTKNIEPDMIGQIKIGGESWSALSENNILIEEGTKVLVQSIDGVKAIVVPLNYTK